MSQPWKSYRENSRENWGKEVCQHTRDDLKFGCLLRIADALDKMATPYMSLLREREQYERWNREKAEEIDHLHRVIRSLRGTITRMKKK
jgi:hypothetical protein